LRHEIVDCVTGNPEHRGGRHDEADAVSPERILDAAVLHRRPTDDVEDEDGLKRIIFPPFLLTVEGKISKVII
jgi:hypothetical protein